MVQSQKWLGEGAKGLLSPRSENGVAPVQNGVVPVFAPSPNHFWHFTIFGLSPRTFGLQLQTPPQHATPEGCLSATQRVVLRSQERVSGRKTGVEGIGDKGEMPSSVLFSLVGYRTINAYVARWDIPQMCLCETKC